MKVEVEFWVLLEMFARGLISACTLALMTVKLGSFSLMMLTVFLCLWVLLPAAKNTVIIK